MPVKFRSNAVVIAPNLAASRLHYILRQDVRPRSGPVSIDVIVMISNNPTIQICPVKQNLENYMDQGYLYEHLSIKTSNEIFSIKYSYFAFIHISHIYL